MRIAYFEPIGGASGDMLLGALVDAGGDENMLRRAVRGVLDDRIDVEIKSVQRGAIRARRVAFSFPSENEEHPHRHLSEINDLIEKSRLSGTVKKRAQSVFKLLADAEGRVHGRPPSEVTLHEAGADDCIADIIGFFALCEAMRVKWFYCGTIPLGCGYFHSEHGELPLPPPASIELLKGFSVQFVHEPHEMTTPTAAAIIRTVCQPHTPPQMVVESVGYGAGTREKNVTGIPNVLRVTLGKVYMDQEPLLWQLEANIDDAEPRVIAHAVSKAMGSGAVDAWMEPTYGKKGRLGVKICAIVRQKALESVSRVVLEETTTLGLRAWPIQRRELQRRSINLQTPMGEVSVKIGHDGSRIVNVQTEHDSAAELAASSGLPLKAILQATIAAATEAGIMVGAPADIIETVDHLA